MAPRQKIPLTLSVVDYEAMQAELADLRRQSFLGQAALTFKDEQIKFLDQGIDFRKTEAYANDPFDDDVDDETFSLRLLNWFSAVMAEATVSLQTKIARGPLDQDIEAKLFRSKFQVIPGGKS